MGGREGRREGERAKSSQVHPGNSDYVGYFLCSSVVSTPYSRSGQVC